MSHTQDQFVPTKAMSSQQLELYNQIQAFELDQPDVFPFSQRLAKENQWSLTYTQQVIEEYKKFLFLAIAADHQVAPSYAVDQAWHLHLTYTHSYWDDLCAQILQKPLHHHPLKAGATQQELSWQGYSKTLKSYENFFGYPPTDIWQPPKVRFKQVGQLKLVSSQDYWLIPKPSLKIAQITSWKVLHSSWVQVLLGALLMFGLILSLHFLYRPALALSFDVVNSLTDQPVFAQASPPSDHYTPPQPEDYSSQDLGLTMWIGFFTIILILISIFCKSLLDSRCPKCKRFGVLKITHHTLRAPTQQVDGEQLVTKRCRRCNYTEQRYESIPQVSDSACCCA